MILEFIFVATILLIQVWKIQRKNKDLPPGPTGLPVVGHLPLLGSKPHVTLTEWKKTYGDIIFCRFGSFPTVILSDPKQIKQIFSMPEASTRAPIQSFVEGTDNSKGIIFSESPNNAEMRHFAIRNLKDFGMGRKTIDGAIQEDLLELIEKIKQSEGQPVNNVQLFNSHVLNSLWTIVLGERMDSKKLNYFVDLVRVRLNHLGSVWCQLAFFMPWMENLARFVTLGNFSFIQDRVAGFKELYAFMGQEVEQTKSTWAEGQPRHVADAYLDTMKGTTDPNSKFHEKHGWSRFFVGDLFLGGVETTSTSLEWLINYMARNIQVQRKMQDEIDRVTGRSRLPCPDDRTQMPYVEAVIYELLRMSSVFSLGMPHGAVREFTFEGYRIPKGTMILANLYGVHHDTEVFKDPYTFRPERWLGAEGSKLKSDHFLAFSTGKRACTGEIMARQQMFLYIATIFQRFNVEFKGDPPVVDSIPAVILTPSPFEVYFRERTI